VRVAGLLREGAHPGALDAVRRRIVVVQGLYAASVLLGVLDTYISIVLILLLQLSSAVPPRFGLLSRL
jgi:type IV secretory pathway TrbD component